MAPELKSAAKIAREALSNSSAKQVLQKLCEVSDNGTKLEGTGFKLFFQPVVRIVIGTHTWIDAAQQKLAPHQVDLVKTPLSSLTFD